MARFPARDFSVLAAEPAASLRPAARARGSGNRQQSAPAQQEPRSRPQEVPQMAEVSFPVQVARGVPVVVAPEEIDVANAAGLRAALLDATAHEDGTVVVDMSRTQFCDSSGLHVLVRAHKRAQAMGGEVLLVMCAAPVLRIFAVTGIARMIPTFSTLDQALAQTRAVPGLRTLPWAPAREQALETPG